MTAYGCIVADPPWAEHGGGRIKRGADRHYPLMKTSEIARVMVRAPCWRPAADSHLWLWVTNNFLTDGLGLMESLGFRYVTNLAWVKMRNGALQQGLGQYLRGSHELCLFGVRGKARLPDVAQLSVLLEERTKHSRKPQGAFSRIQKISPGPYLEMFAREPRHGWDVWGNEVESFEVSGSQQEPVTQ